MFHLTIKELIARRRRLVSSIFAVLLGVTLMAGTLVFTDTMTAAGDSVLEEARAGVDAMVREPSDVDIAYGQVGPRMDASVLDVVRRVPGVEDAALQITGYAQLVDADGDAVGDQEQAAAFGFNWIDNASLNPYRIDEGHAPQRDDEIVIDRGSADDGGFTIGDAVTVLTQRAPATFVVSGIATFGSADSPAGATAVLFTDSAAQTYLSAPGQVDGIVVDAVDEMTQQEMVDRLAAAVPGLEAVTGATLVADDQAAFHDSLGPFRIFLLVFAFVAVFVGAFMINNTFSITVAQRTQQLAMVRALGASKRQVLWSVMAEAAAIGVTGAAAGLGAGIGLAAGLTALFESMGVKLPEGAMVIDPTSMVLSAGIGITITLVSAWMPARRAGKVPPVAALREIAIDRTATSKRRTAIGVVITGLGCVALLAGLGGAGIELVGVGAFVTLCGVAVLGPVLARPVIGAFGVFVRRRGTSGDMAVRNARRNPKRTARTASSLMIGVALVAFIAVLASSLKASFQSSLDDTFIGTHIVDSGAYEGRGGFSPDLADVMEADAGVSVVSESRVARAVVDGSEIYLFGETSSTIGEIFDLGHVDGDIAALGTDGIAVEAEYAADHGWQIGSPIDVTMTTGSHRFVVKATYDNAAEWLDSYFVDVAAFDRYLPAQLDYRIYAVGDDSRIHELADAYPSTTVMDKAEFKEMVNGELDTVLGIVYALLALAVIIALLGIANTLALSIHERTRELGLLRAVGMSRRQMRTVVRWESVMIALFGTALGLVVGSFFGWAVVGALRDEGVDQFTYPVANLAVVTVIACLAGAVAAIGPARRASRLDVLDALVAT
ncbi:MAG: ABC transporter permease [Ilumatobacteraceae bacterium]